MDPFRQLTQVRRLPWWAVGGRQSAVDSLARSGRLRDIEDLVETGEVEHVADVAADVDQPQLLAALGEFLLSGQQDAESGAGDVVEARQVDGPAVVEAQEDAARLIRFGSVEAAAECDVVFPDDDVEHVS